MCELVIGCGCGGANDDEDHEVERCWGITTVYPVPFIGNPWDNYIRFPKMTLGYDEFNNLCDQEGHCAAFYDYSNGHCEVVFRSREDRDKAVAQLVHEGLLGERL